MNTPIQGSAADIINIAMIKIDEKLKNYESRMILQVHDELLFEVKDGELDKLSDMVKREMEGAWKLIVPIKVEIGTGGNWAEAH
jgi:DNA polymerase-1